MRGVVVASLVLLLPPAARAVSVTPQPILVGAFFRGTEVVVRGATSPDTHVFVTITGSSVEERFNRKGRLGPLWANVGKVTVAGVPRLHLVAGTVAADRVLDRALVDRHLLDLDALARTAAISPAADAARLRREYVRLKQHEGAFAVIPGAVTLGPGGKSYEARLRWADRAPVGAYRVRVLHVRGGAVVREEEGEVRAQLAGFPRLIAHLAFDRSALNGVLAVAASLAVGFLMGLVFKRRGGGGH